MSTPDDRPIVLTRDNYVVYDGGDRSMRRYRAGERYQCALVIEADWEGADKETKARLRNLAEMLEAQEANEDGQHRSRAPGGGPG
jgi:hypothetical protein